MRHVSDLVLVAASLACPCAATAAFRASSPEFQVNSYSTGDQAGLNSRAVARRPDGSYVVVWGTLSASIPPDSDVFLRRFDSQGQPEGPDQIVTPSTPRSQQWPAVAMRPDGSSVVVWQEGDGTDLETLDVYGRVFDGNGNPAGTAFLVNTYTTKQQAEPRVAAGPGGEFVVVWEGRGFDGDSYGVAGQRYDSTGAPLGTEFVVNTYTTAAQSEPAIAFDQAGSFIVVWASEGEDGADAAVFARRYGSDGLPAALPMQVNLYTTGAQDCPDVAHDPGGGFVVVWESYGQDGDDESVIARRLDADGVPTGTEFQANTYTTAGQQEPAVAVAPDGALLVVWESTLQDGDEEGIYAQAYAPDGSPEGVEFIINSYTTMYQDDPSIAFDADGNVVVVWESLTQDGSFDGMFGRHLCRDADGDGHCDVPPGGCGRGDCNLSGSMDAGDPICSVLCLIDDATGTVDCSCGADCNCSGSIDAGDAICTVLRLVGTLAPDQCPGSP